MALGVVWRGGGTWPVVVIRVQVFYTSREASLATGDDNGRPKGVSALQLGPGGPLSLRSLGRFIWTALSTWATMTCTERQLSHRTVRQVYSRAHDEACQPLHMYRAMIQPRTVTRKALFNV